MSAPQLESEKLTLILVGNFNPQIFQPHWFARQELVPSGEADTAEINVIHPEITDLVLGGWCHLSVASERFSLATSRPERYPPLIDLAVGTFTLLKHTPITAIGINRNYVYNFSDEQEWHRLGHALAPKEPWAGVLGRPGLLGLQMQGERQGEPGNINVTVQPAPGKKVGFAVNDHFLLSSSTNSASEAVALLQKHRKISLEMADSIVNQLMNAR